MRPAARGVSRCWRPSRERARPPCSGSMVAPSVGRVAGAPLSRGGSRRDCLGGIASAIEAATEQSPGAKRQPGGVGTGRAGACAAGGLPSDSRRSRRNEPIVRLRPRARRPRLPLAPPPRPATVRAQAKNDRRRPPRSATTSTHRHQRGSRTRRARRRQPSPLPPHLPRQPRGMLQRRLCACRRQGAKALRWLSRRK